MRAEELELLFAPHQWCVAATRSVGVVVDSDEPVRRDALRLPLQLERLDLLDVDVVPHEAVRQVTEQDLLRAGGLLETRGDVDGVSRDEPLSGRRIARDHRARVHAGANRQADAPAALELVVQDRLRPLHVRGRAHGAQRVVLVHGRQAEHGHDGVADELFDDASVPFELGAHRVEVAGHDLAQRLGVELLAHRGGALEVREDDRDDLAYLLCGWRGRSCGERRPAREAELRDVRVVGPAL